MIKYILVLVVALAIAAIDTVVTDHDSQLLALTNKTDSLEGKVKVLEDKVGHQALVIRIMTEGASKAHAAAILSASTMYKVDPVILTLLAASESSFKHRIHDLPYVKGLCGINIKVWTKLPHNPHTDSGNIHCSAYILRHYLNKSGEDYEEAITRYKGWSSLGKVQAKKVMESIR